MLLSFRTQNVLEELLQVLGFYLGKFYKGLMEVAAEGDWGVERTPHIYK